MKHIFSALKKTDISRFDIVVSVILITLAYTVPLFTLPVAGELVGASMAVFAIVSGFFIADATANYLRLQTLIAEENGTLISIAHTLKTIGRSDKEVQSSIDAYMIAQLDIDELDHTLETKEDFDHLIDILDNVVAEEYQEQGGVSGDLESEKDRLIGFNQEITLTAHSNLTAMHWGILLVLSVIVAITVLGVRDGSFIMGIVVSGALLGTFGVLVVLRDVDNNRYLQRKLAFRNPQQVFQSIDLPPYYPLCAPKKLMRPNEKGEYRIKDKHGNLVLHTKTHIHGNT